jgi:hypothetical protein
MRDEGRGKASLQFAVGSWQLLTAANWRLTADGCQLSETAPPHQLIQLIGPRLIHGT